MDLYKVIVSPKALSQLEEYVDYIQYTLLNEQAAKSVWEDAVKTTEKLSEVADSMKYCEHLKLRKYGYRKINFLHHRYVMIYRTEQDIVYVEAIYHQLQDYEYTFSKGIM